MLSMQIVVHGVHAEGIGLATHLRIIVFAAGTRAETARDFAVKVEAIVAAPALLPGSNFVSRHVET